MIWNCRCIVFLLYKISEILDTENNINMEMYKNIEYIILLCMNATIYIFVNLFFYLFRKIVYKRLI